MTPDTDLATLLAEGKVESALLLKGDFTDQERNLIRQAYEAGISHGKSSVQTELARLRESLTSRTAHWESANAKLRDQETELARLQQEHEQMRLNIKNEAIQTIEAKEYGSAQFHRAEAAERELARLREGLRPESLARLFHETYERLAPDHGYKTREDSAVLWEDVPAANRALMIATADAVARALLADTPDHAPPDPR